MSGSPFLIENLNVSESWLSAIQKTTEDGGKEITPLVVTLTDFSETERVRKALDFHLLTRKKLSIDTVSETIFPWSLYEYCQFDREKFYKAYNKNLPRIKKIDAHRNASGTYFERMIAYERNPIKINQLENVITSLLNNRSVRRSKLQISIFDPTKDHINEPYQSFPCLQHVTFHRSKNGGLVLNSFYAIQYLFKKAYGNWLGLVLLGKFVAREVGLEFERLNCFIGVEQLDTLTKGEAKKIISEITGRR
ncbi:hypothetical protein [Dyadobacter sp. OTU695]|uniref:hypothetical protein n=1 Tax=Dyadobacter sp. OTU695 TaxID=3043860 RepID=UPI00313E5AA9